MWLSVPRWQVAGQPHEQTPTLCSLQTRLQANHPHISPSASFDLLDSMSLFYIGVSNLQRGFSIGYADALNRFSRMAASPHTSFVWRRT